MNELRYIEIPALLEQIHKEIDNEGYNLTQIGIYDNDDLMHFALSFLLSNLDDALEHTIIE